MKTIRLSRITFSTNPRSKRAVGDATRGRGGQPRCSACRSDETVGGQSAGGKKRRAAHHARAISATAATTRPTATIGEAAIASVQELVAGTPNTVSFMKSVKSSCAMWIHHSCGSLMKIQMKAAMPMTARIVESNRVARDPERLDRIEEVLERVREDEEQPPRPGALEQRDAHEAVVPQESAHPEGRAAHPVRDRRDVGDGEVVDVEGLVVGLIAREVGVRASPRRSSGRRRRAPSRPGSPGADRRG